MRQLLASLPRPRNDRNHPLTTVDRESTSTRQTPKNLPLIAMVVVVLLWGAGPVVTKLITVHPMLGALLRFGLSIPLLLGLVRLRGGRLNAEVMKLAALPGIAFGINLIFVFAAVQEVPVAIIAVSIALQPTILLLAAGPMFNEKPSLAHVLWTIVGVAGTAGVILGAGPDLKATPLGLFFAGAALLTFTVYFALTRLARSRSAVDPFEWMAAINVWSFLAIIPPALVAVRPHHLDELDRADLFWLLVLAFFTGIAGHVLMSWIHGYIEAARSSLYLLGMNITAVALAWPVHGEPVTWIQAACGLVVLGAVAAVIRIPAVTTEQTATG